MSDPNQSPKPDGKLIVAALKSVSENWLVYLELYEHQAKVAKARFDALVAQGFTESQALQICHKSFES